MKFASASLLALSAAASVNGRFIEKHESNQVILNTEAVDNQKYLVETAPGKTQWVTEEGKWELRRVSLCNRRAVLCWRGC